MITQIGFNRLYRQWPEQGCTTEDKKLASDYFAWLQTVELEWFHRTCNLDKGLVLQQNYNKLRVIKSANCGSFGHTFASALRITTKAAAGTN